MTSSFVQNSSDQFSAQVFELIYLRKFLWSISTTVMIFNAKNNFDATDFQ